MYYISIKSKHLSVGTFAVTSLMVYSTISRVEMEYRKDHPFQSQQNISTLAKESFDNDEYRLKIGISTCLAFWCGIFQVWSLDSINIASDLKFKFEIKI